MAREKTSALYSRYIIDGVKQELTPARMLDSVSEQKTSASGTLPDASVVLDETVEAGLSSFSLDRRRIGEYLRMVLQATSRRVPVAFSQTYTRSRMAIALLDTLWREGRFKMGDLNLRLDWKLNPVPVGNMASFYESVASAADYVDSLGMSLSGYSCTEAGECSLDVTATLRRVRVDGDSLDEPFRSRNPRFRKEDCVQHVFVGDPKSWIVYIPFETAEYRLGGSLLSQVLGRNGGTSPKIEDADYFMDCYEVLREFVEDGVLLSGATVGDGGLLTTVKRMTSDTVNVTIDVSDVLKASGQEEVTRVLFAEVPGVVVQIRDIDFDYMDAELLLQDIAFFPLGHPARGKGDVRVRASEKTGIQKILESLVNKQCGEGED